MKKIIVNGRRLIAGNDIVFEKSEIFGLKIGAKITQIGKRNTGCYTKEIIRPYCTYSGCIEIDGEKYLAFLLPPEGITGWHLFCPPQNVYVLYFIFDFGKAVLGAYRDYEHKILLYDAIFKFYE